MERIKGKNRRVILISGILIFDKYWKIEILEVGSILQIAEAGATNNLSIN